MKSSGLGTTGSKGRRLVASFAIAAWVGFGAAGAAAQVQSLEECLLFAEREPDAAKAWADGWARRGGGPRARLCEAMADYHAGRFKEAAATLEPLADRLGEQDARLGLNVLTRAAWSWLRAGDAGRADYLYSRALEKAPGDVDLLIDRSYARADGGRFKEAAADLTAAIARDPQRAEAYLLRSGALLKLGDVAGAAADIARALALRPDDPDVLLARGNLHAAKGEAAAAAADWTRVRTLAPRTAAGRAAAANLERQKQAR